MALKQAEQAKLEGLNQTVEVLVRLNHDQETIKEQTLSIANELEESTGCKLVLSKNSDGKLEYDAIDLKGDSLVSRFNAEKTLLSLKGKILGLPIDIKVLKSGRSYSNEQIASSLTELVRLVRAMPSEIKDLEETEWDPKTGLIKLPDGEEQAPIGGDSLEQPGTGGIDVGSTEQVGLDSAPDQLNTQSQGDTQGVAQQFEQAPTESTHQQTQVQSPASNPNVLLQG